MEEEALPLVDEAARVGDRGKSREAATQKIDVRWLRPPVVEKLTTGPLGGFCQAKAVRIVLSDLSAEAPGGRERVPRCMVAFSFPVRAPGAPHRQRGPDWDVHWACLLFGMKRHPSSIPVVDRLCTSKRLGVFWRTA